MRTEIRHGEKDNQIVALVTHLWKLFGQEQVLIADHWEADLSAIGLSDNSRKHLVYVSIWKKLEGKYDVCLEDLSEVEAIPYIEVGWHENVSLEQVEDLVRNHLLIVPKV